MARGAAARATPAADGRVRRGQQSDDAIVTVRLEVGAQVIEPTAQQVAARAGVGLRTVFRRFEDMEGLFAEVDARVHAQALPLLVEGHPAGDALRAHRPVQARGQFEATPLPVPA